MTAARLQCCSLFLAGLEYDIDYENTKRNYNADGLSRLPLPQTEREEPAIPYTDQ